MSTKLVGPQSIGDGFDQDSHNGRAISLLQRTVVNISNVSKLMRAGQNQQSELQEPSKDSNAHGDLNDLRNMVNKSPRSSSKPFPDHLHRSYRHYTNYTPTDSGVPKNEELQLPSSNLNYEMQKSLRSQRNRSNLDGKYSDPSKRYTSDGRTPVAGDGA